MRVSIWSIREGGQRGILGEAILCCTAIFLSRFIYLGHMRVSIWSIREGGQRGILGEAIFCCTAILIIRQYETILFNL